MRRHKIRYSNYPAVMVYYNSYLWRATGCWLWLYSRDKDGYGQVKFKGKNIRVNRLSAHAYLGLSLNSNLWVLHRCGRPQMC